ncbi:hydroxysqualene dehydroxylase HpnE [Piscinibacter sakaiensis]|uniref:hydroxysqualene dehydroxylase HpnE n=1 Tax=Piscinibacter sakaiensis TaxID=1547922 RepID=UPI003AADA780
MAVVGAGWAGLAAALEACERGHRVSLFEMAAEPGGRARQVAGHEDLGGLDNGQHILIGAYNDTLALMQRVGVDPAQVLLRMPLRLVYPDGGGLLLPAGPPALAFLRGVLGQSRWSLADRLALLRAAARWRIRGFRCKPELSVAELTSALPPTIRSQLIDPLCVAAMNTPSSAASAEVFLRVLRDALFAGPGASDLLLPRQRLSRLLPAPAIKQLAAAGARVRTGTRVRSLQHDAAGGWRVDSEPFDAVILATTATEAARLTAAIAPAWSASAAALQHEPIVTLSVRSVGTVLAHPMLALDSDDSDRPVQFVFDQGQLGASPGLLTLVVSGAAPWLERGHDPMVAAALRQLAEQLGSALVSPPELLQVLTDKRATFRCTPGLQRPSMRIANGLYAAADFVDGPYPATLEGAVRNGLAAARAI